MHDQDLMDGAEGPSPVRSLVLCVDLVGSRPI
jgi:hypothetical protein